MKGAAPAAPPAHCAHFAFQQPRPKPALPAVVALPASKCPAAACFDQANFDRLIAKLSALAADDNYVRGFYSGQIATYNAP
jgi:hypothetical protein